MLGNLRRVVMAGALAAAGVSGLGVSAARACDHGPALGFGPPPGWGYGGPVAPAMGFGGLPDYDHCPVCQQRFFVPPPCPPPPCVDEYPGFGVARRLSYQESLRVDFPLPYPAPLARYVAPQVTAPYEAPEYTTSSPTLPTKQAPGVYGTPQYSDPAPVAPAPYAVPQARGPYSLQAPPANYDQAPPLPTPSGGPPQ